MRVCRTAASNPAMTAFVGMSCAGIARNASNPEPESSVSARDATHSNSASRVA
jgi:hypothetical protein